MMDSPISTECDRWVDSPTLPDCDSNCSPVVYFSDLSSNCSPVVYFSDLSSNCSSVVHFSDLSSNCSSVVHFSDVDFSESISKELPSSISHGDSQINSSSNTTSSQQQSKVFEGIAA